MLSKYLTEKTICFAKECENWEIAVWLSGKPLLDIGAVNDGYIDACIENVKKYGPYIVLAPLVAMPHAKAPEYINFDGISYLNLSKPVSVMNCQDRCARVFIMLATKKNENHLEGLAALSEILGDDVKRSSLINATCTADVLKTINGR